MTKNKLYKFRKIITALTMILAIAFLSACNLLDTDSTGGQSFAEARSNFTTTLTQNNSHNHSIPTPPPGVFDLVHYESEVGNLAAFVSSDPGDGQQHPLIIWLVGGWSYGISDIPWSYPEWDNDQTGSAFREAGILMMYPSLRGAHGNPGYFETMFGDIDDVLAAARFAASLPYVDPNRIYLGGHSTGGTRALLASALGEDFRAIFAFSAADDIGNHNRAQFTFDINNRQERRMRSPIHWIGDISSPTFVIGYPGASAANISNIERRSNDNVHTFVVEGGDHFNILAPITRLLAQKILEDTGQTVNISLTNAELQNAMNNRPQTSPMPIMIPHHNQFFGVSFLLPAIWSENLTSDQLAFIYASEFYEDNFWEASSMLLEIFDIDDLVPGEEMEEFLGIDSNEFSFSEAEKNGYTVLAWEGEFEAAAYFNKIVVVQYGERLAILDFISSYEHMGSARPMFAKIVDSVSFE